MKEAPDNLVSRAKINIVDALCEGKIKGFVGGNDDYGPLKSTYLNETPMMNSNNTFNYNISGDYNYDFTLGTVDQSALSDYGYVENFLPLPANTELKQLVETPTSDIDYKDVTVTLNNRTYPDARTIRFSVKVPQLFAQVDPTPENGLKEVEINPYEVKFIVEISTNGGDFEQQGNEISINGKTMSGFSQTLEFPLPSDGENFISWKIRIRRKTLSISSYKVANTLVVQSMSVISGSQYRYPNTVVVGMEIDAEKFGSIPSRAYEIEGLLVKIPDNYNPVTRQYTGIWLGNFKSGTAEGSNEITNGQFTSAFGAPWSNHRSTTVIETSSPPGSETHYATTTVDTAAAGDKEYFSIYQEGGLTGGDYFNIKGWYKVSTSDLSLKVGINNHTTDQYYNVGNATTWTYFEVVVRASSYADWMEFAAVRNGECLATDKVYLTALEVTSVATDGKEYTNNPAWVFYDIATNPRYGLGSFIKEEWIDKFTLYQIAQYCDEMVDDGDGGLEPRMTANVVLTRQEDAYKVLLSFVSVFRGMLYFSNGRLFPVQDALKTFVYQFTNANVIDGVFNYAGSSKRTRHTIAKVRWNDPENFYRETIEIVEDTDAISRYGYQEMDMTAFACTSQGQAHRAGKWALVSEALETETVTFKTAIEGNYIRPGDIFQIQDNERYGIDLGGRVLSTSSESGIKLDRTVELPYGNTYNLTIITPRSYLDGEGEITGSDQVNFIRNSQITTRPIVIGGGITGDEVTTTSGFGSNFGPGSVWMITAVNANANVSLMEPKQYRCLAVSEFNQYEMEVLGLEYVSGKFALIETGFSIVNNEVYDDTPTAPPKPGGFNVGGTQILGVDYVVGEQQGFFRDYFQLDWFPVDSNILKFYRVRMTPPGGAEEFVIDTNADTYSYSLPGCREVGYYRFSVTSVGRGLSESAALTGGYNLTATQGISAETFDTPSPITGVYATPLDTEWFHSGFESRTPVVKILKDTGDYEGNDPRFFYITGYKYDFISDSSPTVIIAGTPVAEEYIQLTSANISSLSDARTFRCVVTPLTCLGQNLIGFDPYTGILTNKAPLNSVTSSFTAASDGIQYNIRPNALDTDISGVYIWRKTSMSAPVITDTPDLISESLGGTVITSPTGTYYMYHALIDSYSQNGCTVQGPSSAVHYRGATASEIAPGAINNINQFFEGIQPIQVVTSLPVSATTGQVVFLTTDKKLYRYNGTTWVRKIEGNLDIEASSITSDVISGGAIIAGLVAADAISGNNIIAGSITVDKLFVQYLSGISADLGTITAGSITLNNGTFARETVFQSDLIRQGYFRAEYLSTPLNRAGVFGARPISSISTSVYFSASLATDAAIIGGTTDTSNNLLTTSFSLGTRGVSTFNSGVTVNTNDLTVNSAAHFYNSINNYGTSYFELDSIFRGDLYIGTSTSQKSLVLINDGGKVFFGTEHDSDVWWSRDGSADTVITQAAVKGLSFTSTSSRKYKDNVLQITNALDIVNQLTGVNFDWNINDKKKDIGFIAEDVNNVLPSIVMKDSKGSIEGLDYGKVTAVLVEAVKELNQKVSSLEDRLNSKF